jgi:MFS family permease
MAALIALFACASLLALGSAAVFPFEMDTVVSLAGNRLVATHYGFYNTVVGIGILIGNLATGAILQVTRDAGVSELLWGGLLLVGALAAVALHRMSRAGDLDPIPEMAVRPE